MENKKDYFSFSKAIEELKSGRPVQRKFWKGKGNYIFIEHGRVSKEHRHREIAGIPKVFFAIYETDIVTRLPNICFRDTNGNMNNGWQPNANDMLADDWCVYVKTNE